MMMTSFVRLYRNLYLLPVIFDWYYVKMLSFMSMNIIIKTIRLVDILKMFISGVTCGKIIYYRNECFGHRPEKLKVFS